MRVAVHYRSDARDAAQSVALVEGAGGAAGAFHADLADPAAATTLVRDVVGAFGELDVLVNSAAVMLRTPFGEVTPEAWDATFALNVRAPFFLAQAAAPHLAERRGAIVNIADLAAFETWPGYIPHGASKAAVVQLTRALARRLAPAVRVNAVAPGAVLLPDSWSTADGERLATTTPLRRLGAPEDVAHAVLYLLEADYVTGETLLVDGGRHVRT